MIYVENNNEIFGKNLLRYGHIISDQTLRGENFVRIRQIVMDERKYLHYMVNGEVKDIVYLDKVQTYRFYFSRYQKELHRIFQNMTDVGIKIRTDEIPLAKLGGEMSFLSKLGWKDKYIKLTDDREVEFTQICIGKEECSFKDAVLVAEMTGTEEIILQRIYRR